MLTRVLLAIDEAEDRGRINKMLTSPDLIIDKIKGRQKLWERLARENADIVIASRSLVHEPAGDMVRQLKESPENPELVVLLDRDNPEERGRLLAAGCDNVLSLDLAQDVLADVLNAIVAKRKSVASRRGFPRRVGAEPRLSDFVSASSAMQAFMAVVERVAPSDASLLIIGETGVGKERLARAIHAESRRAHGPFTAVNCAALPEGLLESELFGHEEGAFTGAIRARRGWFELAHGGTVFLDEIAELPLHLQVTLLRALQEHEIQRIGGERTIIVDCRIMAATNRDLSAEVEAGRFRRDLFYRLGVITLELPPLRERSEDIPSLVDNYIDVFRNAIGKDIDGIEPAAMDALASYKWPGNVRELANVIERAVLLCRGDQVTLSDLPEALRPKPAPGIAALLSGSPLSESGQVPGDWLSRPLKEVVAGAIDRIEKEYITAMLRKNRGRVGDTARAAGITSRSLFGKMKELGLSKEDFKASDK